MEPLKVESIPGFVDTLWRSYILLMKMIIGDREKSVENLLLVLFSSNKVYSVAEASLYMYCLSYMLRLHVFNVTLARMCRNSCISAIIGKLSKLKHAILTTHTYQLHHKICHVVSRSRKLSLFGGNYTNGSWVRGKCPSKFYHGRQWTWLNNVFHFISFHQTAFSSSLNDLANRMVPLVSVCR